MLPWIWALFTEKQCLGEVKINSAFLGGIFSFVGSPFGLLILLLIPAGYLIVTSGIDIYKALEEKEKLEEEQTTSSSSGEGGKLDTLSEADRERLKQELLEEMLNKKKE